MSSTGLLSVTFSESVAWSSVQPSSLQLQTDAAGAAATYALTGGMVSTLDIPVVTIALTTADLNAIKLLFPLATSAATSFISVTSTFATDTFNNPVIAISSSTALQVKMGGYVADVTLPTLVWFDLNMNTGVISLSLSEPVRGSSIDVTKITLQTSASASPAHSFRLTASSSHSSTNALSQTIQISTADLNSIKYNLVASQSSQAYLALDAGVLVDMSSLAIAAVTGANARSVHTYVADTTAPQLTDVKLDMNAGLLTLTFAEPINLATITYQYITLTAPDGSNYALTGGSVASNTQTAVVLAIITGDLNHIKLIQTLAVSTSTTMVHLTPSAVFDLASAANPNVDQTVAATSFTPDTTSPVVTGLSVDMDQGVFVLNFNEPVLASSFGVTYVTLQGTNDGLHGTVTLTASSIASSINALSITITVSNFDLNNIKAVSGAYVSLASTFISYPSTLVDDMAGNAVVAGTEQATQFHMDVTNPRLTSFDLNVNGGTAVLVLHFSETINVASIDASKIVLQSSSTIVDAHMMVALTGSSVVTAHNSPDITINIATAVLDQMKINRIGLTSSTAWVVLDSTAVSDVIALSVVPRINAVNALAVSSYTPDTTPPMLLDFIFNLNDGTLTLDFSEPVDAATLQAILLQLQSASA